MGELATDSILLPGVIRVLLTELHRDTVISVGFSLI